MGARSLERSKVFKGSCPVGQIGLILQTASAYQVILTNTHAIGVIESFANKVAQSKTNAIVQSLEFEKQTASLKVR